MIKEQILLNKIIYDGDNVEIREIQLDSSTGYLFNNDGILEWVPSLPTTTIVEKETPFEFDDSRVGLGRKPLRNYKFDIKTGTLETALHIGDGKYGFSMGNGTSQGFIPQIIGMGADENDAGLYFIAKTDTSIASNVPMIVVDGLTNNRPLFGIANGNYNKFKFLVDINGTVTANNFQINESLSFTELLEVVKEQQEVINDLTEAIKELQNNFKKLEK